ncbi:phosphate/phosphite/phosphonate ABC transporter substrate-binding protein [Nostoc sp. FACHB-152]|uniref:substrate-binding domain-containing protein n=1 Tax=unclassified Nostoc TaxID=2593658 RepID=UPI001683D6D3|nr:MULTISPECIES: phosphate/phosphite/phosphonate ABC transporter substrate-binding protein [unclassified Nostoc]MBD2449373.1 phosphate/phosphite/phosphonate ABC transporter substrate-binding protein [Nostoc sp. FACHB-152]MBD2470712.1 phosphate/phosphite/phosphonate ABC transporter substrate-binding protein [Nostoc sp. FACHB-145]
MEKGVGTQQQVPRSCLFKKSRFLTLAVVLLLGAGCTKNIFSKPQPILDSAVNNKNHLSTLKVGVLPTQSRTEQERMIKPLDEYLEKSLGRQVDFQIGNNYKEVVDWLVQGKLDMAYLGPVTYLEAVEKGAKVEPLVAPIDKQTGQPWYRSCIIVKADSPIKTIKDLKGKRVAFVDKSSTSGYLMAAASLKKLEINPNQDLAKVIFASSHSKSMEALENGIVDASVTNISSYLKRQKQGKLTPQNSRVIWESAPIPHSPIVISQKLSPELIFQLKKAFISSPDGIEDIVGTESAGYTLVIPSDYAPIQQLRQELNLISTSAK